MGFGERHVQTDQLIVSNLINKTDETDRQCQKYRVDLEP